MPTMLYDFAEMTPPSPELFETDIIPAAGIAKWLTEEQPVDHVPCRMVACMGLLCAGHGQKRLDTPFHDRLFAQLAVRYIAIDPVKKEIHGLFAPHNNMTTGAYHPAAPETLSEMEYWVTSSPIAFCRQCAFDDCPDCNYAVSYPGRLEAD